MVPGKILASRSKASSVCPHGVPYGEKQTPVDFLGMAYTVCQCCLSPQHYTDSSVIYWGGQTISKRHWTRGLCADCGGYYIESPDPGEMR